MHSIWEVVNWSHTFNMVISLKSISKLKVEVTIFCFKIKLILEMSSVYEERLNISIGAIKNLIRKIKKILEGVAKHTNLYIPKTIKELIS